MFDTSKNIPKFEPKKPEKFDVVIGKTGTWFVPQNQDADNIFVSTKDKNGFGGREIEFTTDDGVEKVKGPWHSNSTSLKADTGIDLNSNHMTFGVVAEIRQPLNSMCQYVYKNVVYKDTDWTMGLHERITIKAKELSDKLRKPLYYSQYGVGGSSHHCVYPNEDI